MDLVVVDLCYLALTHSLITNRCLCAISKFIYKIGLELKKSPKSAPDYQHLLIELETLDRALKLLQCIKPAQQAEKARGNTRFDFHMPETARRVPC
jgi:hypothetical protein